MVAALQDPDPRTAGRGFARLRAAGIEVETGVEAAAAARLNAGFLLRFSKRPRPFVTLKLAGSLDGRIATAAGDSRWITGTAARTRGHVLRATHDAVMVGIGTVLADDPELTCRLPGLAETRPLPIVLDRNLRMPLSARLARAPALVFAGAAADPARRAALRERGVEVVEAAERDGTLDLADCLGIAAARGVTRILCEGGGRVAASLIAAGLADEILRFTGGLAIGGDGIPAIGALGLAALSAAPRFRLVGTETCGGDVAELWARDHVNESQPI